MRAVIQRVTEASVSVDGETVGAIGAGLVILIGITHSDDESDARWLAQKIASLRIFEGETGKFDRSVLDIAGSALVVSQFTLYADSRRGRRPDFIAAARPQVAEPLIERFITLLREQGLGVKSGIFGAMMVVKIFNDGPVTIILDSPSKDPETKREKT